jgi:PIN domain nuclease of toxin-antitoxin system
MTPETNKVIVDASAFLAVAQGEPGAEWVIPQLSQAWMSAVNLSELVTILSRRGLAPPEVVADVQQLIQGVIPFDEEQTLVAACLVQKPSGQKTDSCQNQDQTSANHSSPRRHIRSPANHKR